MHNAAFQACNLNAVYLAMTVSPTQLAGVVQSLAAMGCLGASVTVPHKEAVMNLCDTLAKSAQQVGAVNTLEFCSDGSICGHNTDAQGYVRAFEEAFEQSMQEKVLWAHKRVVLLGTGGAARAVATGLNEAGIASLDIVGRSFCSWSPSHPWEMQSLEALLPQCDLLVDCTSIGLHDNEAQPPSSVPVELLPPKAVVSSLVYHRTTNLLAAAQKQGILTLNGEGMLLHQGALAFTIWTQKNAPLQVMKEALKRSK